MRHVRAALIGLSTTAALVAASGLAPGANASVDDESTPVPIVTREGQISSYVVNVGGGRTAWGQAHRAVDAAEGDVVQDWPQIRVIIVHSTNETFRSEVVSGPNPRSVEAIVQTLQARHMVWFEKHADGSVTWPRGVGA